MSAGELATRWTVRVALLLYLYVVLDFLAGGGRRSPPGVDRLAWTVGCGFFVAHVLCALAFFYEWSHAVAYRETARQTLARVGWNSGAGLYFNYVFALAWLADATWWWVRPQRYATRPPWIGWGLHGFMLFMALNGTVVFGAPAVRGWGIAGVVCVGLAIFVGIRRRKA